MKKSTLATLIAVVFAVSSSFAQTLEDGKKFFYYERFKSARETLQKVSSANPDNEEAAYWLGMSMIMSDARTAKDLSDAKSLFQSKLSNSKNTLIMAGIGHIELIEGKIQDARNHFEAAVSLSQGNSIPVLNAIGFANGNPDAVNGDPQYAIQKLKQATQIKKFNDPDVWVNLGDAYRLAGDGGNAVLSYQAALAINPKYARAHYRIGKVYQSQGRGQESIFMEHYQNAMTSDPAYAPVYANLFNYYYETNVPLASDYFEKWQANSDVDDKSCYYRAMLKYAQGFFMEAVSKADECIAAEGNNPLPSLYNLKANAFNKMKDSVHTLECYSEYFKRQVPDKITSLDYLEYAKNLLKFPGNEAQAGVFIDKAVAMDTLEANKVMYLKSVAQAFEAKKSYKDAADWYNKILSVKKSPGKVDLYNVGYNYYKGQAYDTASSFFKMYAQKYPDDIFGHFMSGKTGWIIDSTLQQGLANEGFEKTILIGQADTVKYKSQLITSYRYFATYYFNIKKDKASAIQYLDRLLALDPNDAEAMNNRAIMSKSSPGQKPKEPVKRP